MRRNTVFKRILIGSISVLMWFLNYVSYVRQMSPCTLFFGIIFLITTVIIKLSTGLKIIPQRVFKPNMIKC